MCNFRFSLILPIALSLLSGCGTTGAPPITYAQNPFNPFPVKLKDRPVSPSTVVGAAGIALNAASPSVPGALSPGAGAGVASGLFLLKGLMNVRLHEQSAENQNALNMQMPISDATNETDAENKARTITDKATVAALPPDYQAKSESYDDIYKGKYWRR